MEKAVAARMMGTTLSVGHKISKLDSIISDLESGREKDELVQALGAVMSILTRDIVIRIAREHPELDPDR